MTLSAWTSASFNPVHGLDLSYLKGDPDLSLSGIWCESWQSAKLSESIPSNSLFSSLVSSSFDFLLGMILSFIYVPVPGAVEAFDKAWIVFDASNTVPGYNSILITSSSA